MRFAQQLLPRSDHPDRAFSAAPPSSRLPAAPANAPPQDHHDDDSDDDAADHLTGDPLSGVR